MAAHAQRCRWGLLEGSKHYRFFGRPISRRAATIYGNDDAGRVRTDADVAVTRLGRTYGSRNDRVLWNRGGPVVFNALGTSSSNPATSTCARALAIRG